MSETKNTSVTLAILCVLRVCCPCTGLDSSNKNRMSSISQVLRAGEADRCYFSSRAQKIHGPFSLPVQLITFLDTMNSLTILTVEIKWYNTVIYLRCVIMSL